MFTNKRYKDWKNAEIHRGIINEIDSKYLGKNIGITIYDPVITHIVKNENNTIILMYNNVISYLVSHESLDSFLYKVTELIALKAVPTIIIIFAKL